MVLGLRAKDVRAFLADRSEMEAKRGPADPHPDAVMIWGPPGVGKSDTAEDLAADLKIGYVDVRMLLLDPTDMRGIPFPDLAAGHAKWLHPSFLPNAKRDGPRGILNLDELPAAPPLVQASAYQLVWNRKLGEYELPDGWGICATGNRLTDRAISHRMPTPLKTRFVHIDFGIGFGEGHVAMQDLEDWTNWAIDHAISEKIIGFLNFKSDALFNFKPDKDERTFACPRTWAMASGLMHLRTGIFDAALEGTVGTGAAAEFKGYLKVYSELPDIDKILAGGFTIPARKDIAFATVTACAVRSEAKHVDHLLTYSAKMPEGMEELAVLLVKLLKPRFLQAITTAPSFKPWIKRFGDVLLV